MINFLLFILLIGFVIVVFVVVGVLRFFGSITRLGRNNTAENAQSEEPSSNNTHQKIFKQNEGEYVDYEEVD